MGWRFSGILAFSRFYVPELSYLVRCRDDLTRIEEQSRMEQENRSNIESSMVIPSIQKISKKDDRDFDAGTLSEEQRKVYRPALEGYVCFLFLSFGILMHRVCFSLVTQELERVMYCV